MRAVLALLEHVAGPGPELIQALDDVSAFVLVAEECRGGQRCEFPGALQLLLDLAVKATGCQPATTNQADKRRLQRGPAEARDQAAKNILWKLGRVHQRQGILDVRANRVQGRSDFHHRLRPASDTQDRALDIEASNGFRQPFIVSEDDHLARTCSILQRPRQPVDARRIHRLNRVVDHDKAKGTGRKCGPRQEQAQRERVQLTLAHDAKGGAGNAIDSDVKRDTPLALGAGKLDPSKLDVAVLAKMLPGRHRLIGDRRESLVSDFRGCVLQPVLGSLDPRNILGCRAGVACRPGPRSDRRRNRTPAIFATPELRGRRLSESVYRIRESLMQRFEMCREGEEIVGRASRVPLFPPLPHDVEAIEADVEQLLEQLRRR